MKTRMKLSANGREHRRVLPVPNAADIIVNIRRIEVSGAESPFLTLNVHFTGMCDNACPDCHSRSLWTVKEQDRMQLNLVIEQARNMFIEAGIIDGLCILGTDNRDKYDATRILVDIADNMDMVSIVFTGYDLMTAVKSYGYPDYYVIGRYVKGGWHENKTFYQLVEDEEGNLAYAEISLTEYFER